MSRRIDRNSYQRFGHAYRPACQSTRQPSRPSARHFHSRHLTVSRHHDITTSHHPESHEDRHVTDHPGKTLPENQDSDETTFRLQPPTSENEATVYQHPISTDIALRPAPSSPKPLARGSRPPATHYRPPSTGRLTTNSRLLFPSFLVL